MTSQGSPVKGHIAMHIYTILYTHIGAIWPVLCYEFDILLALVVAELWPDIFNY